MIQGMNISSYLMKPIAGGNVTKLPSKRAYMLSQDTHYRWQL